MQAAQGSNLWRHFCGLNPGEGIGNMVAQQLLEEATVATDFVKGSSWHGVIFERRTKYYPNLKRSHGLNWDTGARQS
jgi:hypothetical protein